MHVLAYALVVLFRESCVGIKEVEKAEVETLRKMLWKIPGVIESTGRRVVVRLSEGWPFNELWQRVWEAVGRYVERIREGPTIAEQEGVPR